MLTKYQVPLFAGESGTGTGFGQRFWQTDSALSEICPFGVR